MAAKFELYKDNRGAFRFMLMSPNGQILATSERYASKAGAQNGIESVRRNAPNAEVVEQS